MRDEQTKMVAVNWISVEAMGIPDCFVRRMSFELADVIGDQRNHELAPRR